MSSYPEFEFKPVNHVHGEPVTVSTCTVQNLAALAAAAMNMLPPQIALVMRISINQQALDLIEAVEREAHAEFDRARMAGGADRG